MHRRIALPFAALILCALALTSLAMFPVPAHAATPGSGNWYWPVGTEDFHGWDGWWVYRSGNHSWHMAQDMPESVGHSVYAIGDGTVLESKPDSGYGGVLVILHRAGDGSAFKAVYGHIRRGSGTSVGSKVKAGQVIGTLNSCRHLHFGIHPGTAYPSDNNPFRGHTYVESKTYGWTDPVKYLRAHPRLVPYSAPPLPEYLRVETTVTPTPLGVADGRAYWTVWSDSLEALFCASPDATSPVGLSSDAVPSAFDPVSFPSRAETDSLVAFDARPSLTVTLSTCAPAWKSAVSITGSVVNAVGRPFAGARVVIEASIDGIAWSSVATGTTGLTGRYTVSYVASRRVGLRARFAPPALYAPAVSTVATVAPKPSVTTPSVPSWISHSTTFTVSGTLAPRHAAGVGATTLEFQRCISGIWTPYRVVATRYRDASAGTAYSARIRLRAGSWRVRAVTPADDRHAAKTTSWRTFTVR